jgi:hypothetical protein
MMGGILHRMWGTGYAIPQLWNYGIAPPVTLILGGSFFKKIRGVLLRAHQWLVDGCADRR